MINFRFQNPEAKYIITHLFNLEDVGFLEVVGVADDDAGLGTGGGGDDGGAVRHVAHLAQDVRVDVGQVHVTHVFIVLGQLLGTKQ